MDAAAKEALPWAKGEPSNHRGTQEYCAEMYRDFNKNYGRYNDVGCGFDAQSDITGYICEGADKCIVEHGKYGGNLSL